jgi:hypothetical protein
VISELSPTASQDIHNLITQTADVYQEAALLAVSSSAAAYHARFLRALLAKDAEWKMHRHARQSMSSSRNSPDDMDEDRRASAMGQYPTAHHGPAQSHPMHPTSPHYSSTFSNVAHATLPPTMHTSQMSPTDTKPTIVYRNTPSTSNGVTNGGGYPHYGPAGNMEYPQHPHPPMLQYPSAVMQPPGPASATSELDMRYSRNLLQELGYPSMGMEPVAEWFNQVMGPSGCAGLP